MGSFMLLKHQPHSAWTSWLLSNQMCYGWNTGYVYNNSAPLLWSSRRATCQLPAGCSSAVRLAVWPTAGGLRLWRVDPHRVGGLEEPAWHQLWWECELPHFHSFHTGNLLWQLLSWKGKQRLMWWGCCGVLSSAEWCAKEDHLGGEQADDWWQQSQIFHGHEAVYNGYEQIWRPGEYSIISHYYSKYI